ncbi:HNH endonuclease [Schinkia azotoformans]|uniref:HNH endonuclease n=1 Tax=Schinkia azotoformans TaxID=1454 RepID=UPI002E2435B2|nr:HNH endonuclease [Schinkia azotoformans]
MAKKSKWKGAALSLLGSVPFPGKVKKKVKAVKKTATRIKNKVNTGKKKVVASLKKAKNKGKKKKRKIKKQKGKVFTKARKLKNNLTKKDLVSKFKKAMKKTVLAAKSVKKKAVKYVKSGMFLDHVQLGLDVFGMIPVAGTVAGVANAGISTARGNYAGAALGLVSCIPIAGTVTKGGKLGLKAAQATKVGEKLATTPKKLVNSPATDSKTINRSITNAPTPKSGKPAPSTGKGISRNSQLKSEPKLPNNLLDKYKVVNKAEMPWGPGNIVKVVKVEKGANLGKSIKKSINSDKGKPKGTRYDDVKIINKKYAGQTYNLSGDLSKKYPNGVKFTNDGFPDFSPYSKAKVKIDGLKGNTSSDFTAANKAIGLKSTPSGYTWHHVEDGRTLMLVPTDLHQAVRHTGGAALIRKGLAP